MGTIETIGLIGSITSIGCAIWASISVGIIKKTKLEIFSRLKIVKYSELSSSSKNTINQLRKIASKDKIPPGINFTDIIDSLNDYYENLNKIKIDIEKDGFSSIEDHMKKLRESINTARTQNRKTPQELISSYTEIYYHVLEIDSKISKYHQMNIEK
jgi:hypothetical protein